MYNTYLHTNNTQNDTKQTIHSTTQILRKIQKFWKSADRAPTWRVIPWHCLTTEEKAGKDLSEGSRTIRIRKPNNKNTQITVLKHGKTSVRVVE
jgi:hypothetical protein